MIALSKRGARMLRFTGGLVTGLILGLLLGMNASVARALGEIGKILSLSALATLL